MSPAKPPEHSVVLSMRVQPLILPLRKAADALGYSSADALRRAFVRGVLPGRFLLRLGRRTLRVDVAGLVEHLRAQAAARGAGAPAE